MTDAIQGVGGVFLYANDAKALAAWYTEHLGLKLETWGESRGREFPSADLQPSERMASTTFSLFQAKEPLPEARTGRINFRVADLDALCARLEAAGLEVEPEHPGAAEYGRFRWVTDPEGNRIELWEPPREDAATA